MNLQKMISDFIKLGAAISSHTGYEDELKKAINAFQQEVHGLSTEIINELESLKPEPKHPAEAFYDMIKHAYQSAKNTLINK